MLNFRCFKPSKITARGVFLNAQPCTRGCVGGLILGLDAEAPGTLDLALHFAL